MAPQVTAAKIEFAYTKDYQKTEADEWVAKTPAAAKSQFGSYIPFLKQPFDESAFRQLLQQLGWRER